MDNIRLPSVVHPKRFNIGGILVQVMSCVSLTDAQAAKVAMLFYRSRKFTKKDQGKLFRTYSLFDQDSVGLL